MLNRIKAIFARRQPPQEQPLPDYALRYFDHWHGAYQSLPDHTIQSYRSLLESIISKRQHNTSLTWRDLYTFDLILTKL
jgi:hypothetical protein